MKLKSYKEYLRMTSDAIKQTLVPVRVIKAQKQAELKIAELDEKIASKEAYINELCTKDELNFDAIINAQDECALLERKKKQLEILIAELF